MMTNEEAIEILQEERDYAQFPKYVKETIKSMTSALEKQIPKKPENRYIDNLDITTEFFACPVCGNISICETEKYCSNCGQRLKWE